jgi:hypothetical protein
MSFKLGATEVKAVKLGSSDVTKLMLGSTLIWTVTPDPPTSVVATAGVNQATLTWTAPATGVPPTDYVVQYRATSQFPVTEYENDFEGADVDPLPGWTNRHADSSGYVRFSGRAQAKNNAQDSIGVLATMSSNDHWVEALIRNDNGFQGIMTRITLPFRNEVECATNSGLFKIVEHINPSGGTVEFDRVTYPGASAGVEYVTRMEVKGNQAQYFVNGVLRMTFTLTVAQPGNQVGIGSYRYGSEPIYQAWFKAGTWTSTDWAIAADAESSATSAIVTGLIAGAEYEFRVASANAYGPGAYSAVSNAVTVLAGAPTVPGAPTGVSGAAGNGYVDLTWTAPSSNGGSPITDYKIEYATAAAPTTWFPFTDAVSTATTATVTGLTNGTAYIFHVAAHNTVGDSTFSSPSGSVTPATFTPANLASLYAWYDANDISTFTFSSGAVIAEWRDKKGGRHLANGNVSEQPNRSSTINGVPVVSFDGSDDQLIVQGWTAVLAQPLSVFIVCRFAGSGVWQALFNVAFQFEILREGGGDRAKWVSGGSDQMVNISTNVPYILGSTYSPYQQRLNGVQIATTNTGSNGIDAWRTGRAGHGGDRMTGSVGEIIICNAALTGSDLTNLESYLMTKWGIS